MTRDTRPISAVLQDIVGNVQDIVRAEVRLARTEVTEQFGKARSAGLFLGLGAAMAMFSIVFFLLAIVYALSLIIPVWTASLIVAAAVGAGAVVMLQLGIHRIKAVRAAPKAKASMKENVEWAKQLTK